MSVNTLKKISIFSELKDEDLEKISEKLSEKVVEKGIDVFNETDDGSNLFVIVKGAVKISRISDIGKEVILAILGDGDFFGEMSLLDGMARSANVTTIEKTELNLLSRDDFLSILNQYPSIAISLLKELASRLRKSDSQIKSLSLYDAEGRVASALIQLAEDQGTIKDGRVKINNMPSQKDLANIAGTSRETISRVLNTFLKSDVLMKENECYYIVNYEKFKVKFG